MPEVEKPAKRAARKSAKTTPSKRNWGGKRGPKEATISATVSGNEFRIKYKSFRVEDGHAIFTF